MILNNLKIFYLFIIIFLFYSLAQAGIEDKDTVPIENTEIEKTPNDTIKI